MTGVMFASLGPDFARMRRFDMTIHLVFSGGILT